MKPKNFLKRVFDYALSELERRARPVDEDEQSQRSGEAGTSYPSGVAPARSADVVQPAERLSMRSAESHTRDEPTPAAPKKAPTDSGERAVEPAADAGLQVSPRVRGLEAVRAHSGDGVTLRWSITQAEVARAQRLVSGKPVLCLRVVSFTKARDDVRREVQDRPGVDLSGECELPDAPERAVVALGLRAGERFISIAHHVI